jgi:hypothetical protein
MRPFQRIISLATLVASVLLATTPARAAQEDVQLWVFLNAVVPVDDGVAATLEVSPRSREGTDQLLLRGSVDVQLSPHASVGGGVAWVDFAGGREFRPHQQVQLTYGPVQFRTRVEERFFAGADRAQVRLRQRVQVTTPVADGVNAVGLIELLYNARPEVRTQSARIDSWRGSLAATWRASRHVELGAGYLAIYSPRAGRDRLAHVPQLRLTVR